MNLESCVSILRSAKTILLQACDVINRVADRNAMAERRAFSPGKTYSVAGGADAVNFASKTGTPGIAVHYMPTDET